MRATKALPFLAVLVMAGCGSSVSHPVQSHPVQSHPVQSHPVQSLTAACDAFHKWALEQPAGGAGTKDPGLLATALQDAPPGKLYTDLTAVRGDAVKSSQGATQELTTVMAEGQVVSDCLGR